MSATGTGRSREETPPAVEDWDAPYALPGDTAAPAGEPTAAADDGPPGLDQILGVDETLPGAAAGAADAAPPLYGRVDEWVGSWLIPVVQRELAGGVTWCAEWWRHAEAISRLEALWRAWEELRLDPAFGMSVWWRDHLDPHLAVLMSRDAGPFAACKQDRHGQLPELANTAAPAGWWGVDTGEADGVVSHDAADGGIADLEWPRPMPAQVAEAVSPTGTGTDAAGQRPARAEGRHAEERPEVDEQ